MGRGNVVLTMRLRRCRPPTSTTGLAPACKPRPITVTCPDWACVAQITVYLRYVLGGWRRALVFGALLALLYGVLYGLLLSEDNALVPGCYSFSCCWLPPCG
jgi:Inner membrane protein CreD